MNVAAVYKPLPVVLPTNGMPVNGNPGIVPPWLQEPVKILPMPDGWDDNTLPVEPEVPVLNRTIDTAFEPWPLEG